MYGEIQFEETALLTYAPVFFLQVILFNTIEPTRIGKFEEISRENTSFMNLSTTYQIKMTLTSIQ